MKSLLDERALARMRSSVSPESWREVRRAPGYQVSSLGRVRSKDTGRVFNAKPRANGYVSVQLVVAGKKTRFYAHRLVAEAFVGPLADAMQVNHLNFVRHDNAASNLEIVSAKENAAHSNRAGHHRVIGRNTPTGEVSKAAKLTAAQVKEIRVSVAAGARKAELARRHGVCKQQIANIVAGTSWRQVS